MNPLIGTISPESSPAVGPSSQLFLLRPADDCGQQPYSDTIYARAGQSSQSRNMSMHPKRARLEAGDTIHADSNDAGSDSTSGRRKEPCVQCAQAGLPQECKQNRRTIGCTRCNAQRLGCSYRTGEHVFHAGGASLLTPLQVQLRPERIFSFPISSVKSKAPCPSCQTRPGWS